MFEGFPRDSIQFFEDLANNNNRDWFAKNKTRYENVVLNPALELVTEMAEPLKKISRHFVAVPKKSGGSLMRIYRDTRFSKDKTPYKLNLGVQFRHEFGKDVHAPGFYFHLDAEKIFVGAGIWRPNSKTLNAIRRHIDDNPRRWKRTKNTKAFKSTFELHSESLKRPPRGYQAEHPLIADLKLKNHIGLVPLQREDIFSRSLIDTLSMNFKTAMPYVRFLCDSIPLPS